MLKKYLNTLKHTHLFADLSMEDLSALTDCLRPVHQAYSKNDIIALAGKEFRYLGIVLKGEAAVYKDNAAGDRIILTLLDVGDMFGEMLAFSNQKVWPVTVQAQENCEVLFLEKSRIVGDCETVCPWHRILINNMLKILSEKALFLNKKVEYLSIKSMRGKIGTYLLEESAKAGSTTFQLPMSRNEMADYLNVSRPSMSREMARMRDEGLIDFHLSTIRIQDRDTLRNMLAT